jgi:hypothetical protein
MHKCNILGYIILEDASKLPIIETAILFTMVKGFMPVVLDISAINVAQFVL